jgi:DNA processing protein
MFTTELVSAGCVIVSGLALGVDSIAHAATVAAGGKTIAVLGCGVDCCNPRENQAIYTSILESGGVMVSEYGLGMQPTKGSFPSRNRIIAGLSRGVIVTEGAAGSGSLITANDAFANERKVFAVPGPITSSLSLGPYELLKKGGTLATSAKDVIEGLGIKGRNPPSLKLRRVKADTKEEQVIIDLLQNENLHIDEIGRQSGIGASQLGSLLSLLEMKGIIKTLDAGLFSMNE